MAELLRPSASAARTTEGRLARAVVTLATAWFALAACWGLFGPILAGHYAASASVGIIADNMIRWGIAGPVWEYTAARPTVDQYYCHHPWGIFWTTAGLMKLLGRHDFVCRLAPVLLSVATPPLLYLLGRAIWRPLAGAIAAAAFTVLPITLSFASFNALEVPVIAYTTFGLWGYVRHQQEAARRRPARRYLLASVAGFALAMNSDWPAFILVGLLVVFELARGLLSGRLGWDRPRVHLRWALATALSAALILALYLWLFQRSGKLEDLLFSYRFRSQGGELPLREVLAARRYWIELSFTKLAILLGVAAAGLSLTRLLVLRRPFEILPLVVLTMATAQYLIFKQGADVHIFWPHYFGQYFALAMGALTATLLAALGQPSRRGVLAMGLAMGLSLALILRDGLPALAYARASGGRFNENGRLIHSDGRKTAFLRWLSPQLPAAATIGMHEGMKPTWAQVWSLGGRVVKPSSTRRFTTDVLLLDTRFARDSVKASLAEGHRIVAVGPFWAVFPGAWAPLEAYPIEEHEPGPLRWYLVSGTEPVRTIVADAYRTWELRTHFEQGARAPQAPPQSFDQRRIAHNLAVQRGDQQATGRLWSGFVEDLGAPEVTFDDGSALVGTRLVEGVRPTLTLIFRAARPSRSELQPRVRSVVERPPPLSTTMADPSVRDVGLPMALGATRWRPGFLYAHDVYLRERPGLERFELYFPGRGAPQDDRRFVELLRR